MNQGIMYSMQHMIVRLVGAGSRLYVHNFNQISILELLEFSNDPYIRKITA